MAKKSKTMIIALAVLLLLGGGYYAATVHNRNSAQAFFDALPPTASLGNLDSADIVRIEVSGMVLEREGERWELVSLNGHAPPRRFDLDQALVRSKTFVLATVWAERIADEAPEDLSVFGLQEPSYRTVVTDSRGNSVVYLVGDITPFRTSYFVMREGNPAVHVVNEFSVDRLRFTLDDIRSRALFPQLPLHALSRVRIESAQAQIDMSIIAEPRPPHLLSTFSRFAMTSPYALVRGVDSQALAALLSPLNNRRIEDFINDDPVSLVPYGLDDPVRLLLEFGDVGIDLLIGNQHGAVRYAKLAGSPEVFTVGGLEQIAAVRPFTLVDKFPLLMGIDEVSRLSITGGERPLQADFHGEGQEMVFYLDGHRIEDQPFREWYQTVIGLTIDAEKPSGHFSPPPETITIVHHLKNPPGEVSITLIPFNRDFYALSQEGTLEFLVARSQVRRIFQAADDVLFFPR